MLKGNPNPPGSRPSIKRWKRFLLILTIVPVICIGACIAYVALWAFLLAGIAAPLPGDDWYNHVDYNPDPSDLAAVDFDLRFLDAAGHGQSNTVFSPPVVAEGMHMTRDASHGNAARQVEDLLESEDTREFPGHAILDSSVPGVGRTSLEDTSVFGVRRSVTVLAETQLNLEDWFKKRTGIAEGQVEKLMENEYSAFGYERDKAWVKDSFSDETNAGDMTWRVADFGGSLLEVTTDIYYGYRWPYEVREGNNLAVGLAPFHTGDGIKMVPTLCIRREHAGMVNHDRDATAFRCGVRSGHEFWMVSEKHAPSAAPGAALLNVHDMQHWEYYDMHYVVGPRGRPGDETTRWTTVQHVHFPRFTATSTLDVKKICQSMGADLAFDDTSVEHLTFAGRGAYIDTFESSLSISVNEHGIWPANEGGIVREPLTCGDPDIAIDQPFNFFLLDYHSFLLLGYVADPSEKTASE